MRALFLTIVGLLLTTSSYCQYYQAFQQEYFQGNLADARAEAMGRSDVAIAERTASVFMNPAAVCNIGKQQMHFSNSGQFIALRNSKYNAFGIARQLGDRLYGGVQINRFNVGPTTFTVDIYGKEYELTKPITSNYAISLGYRILDSLSVAINANIYNWKLFDQVAAARSGHYDIGLLYQKSFAANQQVQFGASFTNVTSSTITYFSPDNTSSTSSLPSFLRAGLAYRYLSNHKLPGVDKGAIHYLVTAQYQDIVNNDLLNGVNCGFEAVLHKLIAVRAGYYFFNKDDNGFANNKARVQEITYGFGINLPVDFLFPGEGAELKLDYTSMRPPKHVYSGRRLLNFRTYSFNLSWPISKN